MGTEKMKFLALDSVYWTNINTDIEDTCETVHYMHGISANTATWEYNTLWDAA